MDVVLFSLYAIVYCVEALVVCMLVGIVAVVLWPVFELYMGDKR